MTPLIQPLKHVLIIKFLSLCILLSVYGNLNAQTITTVAGNGIRGYSGDGGLATKAKLGGSSGPYVAADLYGNFYIADSDNQRIRKVDINGKITTIAGNGSSGFSGDGGLAINSKVYYPTGIIVDPVGNIFIADRGNNRIRKIGINGIINTVAGNGAAGYSGDGGLAINAKLNNPAALGLDQNGNIYISDSQNNRIRKVDSNGIITTVAGNGSAGFSGDGGPATNAMLNGSLDMYVCSDQNGVLYISDSFNNRVRKVAANGTISTFAGNGSSGFSGDGGLATAAKINLPHGLAVDQTGNVFISDFSNNRIRKVNPNGIISTVAGNGTMGFSGDGGPATSAALYSPVDAKLDGAGNLYLSDVGNNRIRKVTFNQVKASQTITFGTLPPFSIGVAPYTLTASASSGLGIIYSSSNTTVVTVSGNTLTILGVGVATITASQPGNVLFNPATSVTQTLTVGQASQSITFNALPSVSYGASPIALSASASSGLGIIYSSSNASVATINGNVLTIVGTGTATITASQPGNANYAAATNVTQTLTVGQASQSITFNTLPAVSYGASPIALTASASSGLGIIYSSSNASVATINGSVLTIVGTGTATITASQPGNANYAAATNVTQTLTVGQASQSITFNQLPSLSYGASPITLTASASSGLAVYYSSSNPAVATINGNVLTIVGAGTTTITASQSGDANYAAATSVTQGLIVTQPTITSISGNGTAGFSGDGRQAISSSLNLPIDVAVDVNGNVFIADYYNNRVRKVATNGIISTVAGNGIAGMSGDGGLAIYAQLNNPTGVVVDPAGNLFISDQKNNRIRKVDTNGVITTFVGSSSAGAANASTLKVNNSASPIATMQFPVGQVSQSISFNPLPSVSYGASSITLTASASSGLRVSYFSSNASVAIVNSNILTIVGPGTTIISASQAGDGTYAPAPVVKQQFTVTPLILNNPMGIALDGTGNLYIADALNNVVRKVDANGNITIIASNLNEPRDVAVDNNGNVYIADFRNHRIQKVTNGTITTVAGNGVIGFSGDGGPAITASLNYPHGIAVDKNGNLLIADYYNNRIRKVDGNGIISTVVGNGIQGFSGDGGSALSAQIAGPRNLSVDGSGNIYFADGLNQRVRKVGQTSAVTSARLSEIEFSALPAKTIGDSPIVLSAYSTSGIPISFSSDNQAVAIVSDNILTIVGIGSANITASHFSNATFNAAKISQPLVVSEKILTKENILYPNPSKDFIYLTGINEDVTGTFIEISTGKSSVINLYYKDGLLVGDIRNLASGNYIIKIISNDQVVQKKLIKP